MSAIIVGAPTQECVTLAEAKAHLRIEHADDDAYITELIERARVHAENYCDRALLPYTVELYLDGFAPVIGLSGGNVRSVEQVRYADANGAWQTWPANQYVLDPARGRLAPALNQAWPQTAEILNAVEITYTIGFPVSAQVPADVKQAMLEIIAEFYERREHSLSGTIINEVPLSAHALLQPYRMYSL